MVDHLWGISLFLGNIGTLGFYHSLEAEVNSITINLQAPYMQNYNHFCLLRIASCQIFILPTDLIIMGHQLLSQTA